MESRVYNQLNIYYLPDSSDEVEDVVIEGEIGFYGPGSNQIDCGIFFLVAGIILFLHVKGRQRVSEGIYNGLWEFPSPAK